MFSYLKTKLYDILFACVLGGIVITFLYLLLGPDNRHEEAIEELIKKETGIEVDLTPFSKEPTT